MTYLFDKLEEFREKFEHYYVSKKKILALDNLSQAVPFHHNEYLVLIKKCLKDGFLSKEETSFLVYLVGKYFKDKNFLDWAHQTKWLRAEMRRVAFDSKKVTPVQQDLFNWNKMREQAVALGSMAKTSSTSRPRI